LVDLLKVTFERSIFHCSVIPLYQREKNVSRSSEKCWLFSFQRPWWSGNHTCHP